MVTIGDIRGFCKRLAAEYRPIRIVLFGSYAKGNPGLDSDVDLLVVERGDFGHDRSRRQEAGRIRRSLRGFNVGVDILVFSEAEIAKWRDSLNHVVGRALREGKTLYVRP